MPSDDVQAWILCMDLLIKVKNELIAEAMELLHREMEAKRISMQGSFMPMSEGESEAERDMFLIQNLLAQEHEIMGKYGTYLVEMPKREKIDEDKIRSADELRKFLMALNRMSRLMRYSRIFDEWASDASYEVRQASVSSILEKTIAVHGSSRREALEFAMKDEELVVSGVLADDEKRMLNTVLSKSGGVAPK